MTCNFLTQATLTQTHTDTSAKNAIKRNTSPQSTLRVGSALKSEADTKRGKGALEGLTKLAPKHSADAHNGQAHFSSFSPLHSILSVCPKQGTAQPKKGKKARLPACVPAWPMWLQFLDYGVAWIFLSVPKPRHKQSGRSPSAINPVEIQHTTPYTHTQTHNCEINRNSET